MSSKVDALCSQDGDTIPVLLCGATSPGGLKTSLISRAGEARARNRKGR